mmetsp:Transcript_54467/g.133527  ORF Transcript_54467/g.133527 Transcript_54467/m.133527 type:complete len:150 (+) Transcript_54467:222-671(+)|eukprot:CAMPEP_0198320182 /NCGR_PEP_ID=MMETSP1450-20131203/9168_1 /TAXON_ID=753684 ORGANISM="Madagascaria erythrocladiodes, Strain CCMP3234" /NCGR_SAMPLE_ID=MMETSP1450 /ASSEMBLY_ACC=CAM_ASM_001115 /LENGTH=149 /DNA_ID=CAMNT_0044023627 /DNA_START=139 /DNA_END=588 /DNA_ORIENTATION=+
MANKIMSSAVVEELREAFSVFDKDGDGTITAEELGIVMRSMGQKPTDQELRDMIREVDADGNESIDFPEFVTLMARKTKAKDLRQELRAIFDIFDEDGSGKISADEVAHIMRNLGEKVTNEEVVNMIKAVDVNGDNEIDFQEFLRLVEE